MAITAPLANSTIVERAGPAQSSSSIASPDVTPRICRAIEISSSERVHVRLASLSTRKRLIAAHKPLAEPSTRLVGCKDRPSS